MKGVFDPGVQYRNISHAFALDFSDAAVKAAEITIRKGKAYLEAVGIAHLSSDVMRHGKIEQPSELVTVIKKLVRETKPKSITVRHVMVSLPHANMYIHPFEFPEKLSEQDVRSAAQYEAEGVLPITLSGTYNDVQFFPLLEKKNNVLFAAAPRDIVDSYMGVITDAGLIPVVVEVDSLSISRALIEQNRRDPVIILDMGSWSSTVITVEKGVVHGSVSVAVGGSHLTEEIASALGIEKNEAEKIKRETPISEIPAKARELVEHKLHILVKEVTKAARYHGTHTQHPFKEVILTGGPASTKGMQEFLQKHTTLSVSIGDSFRVIPNSVVPDQVAKEHLAFAQVVGLAMRGVQPDLVSSGVNLIPPRAKQQFERWWAQRLAAVASFLFALLSLSVFAWFMVWGTYLGVQYLQAQTSDDPVSETIFGNVEETVAKASIARDDIQKIQHFYTKRTDVGAMISDIFAVAPRGIHLTTMSFGTVEENGKMRVTLGGVAETREVLIVFERALRSLAERVDFPTSNLDAPRDAAFTITLYYE